MPIKLRLLLIQILFFQNKKSFKANHKKMCAMPIYNPALKSYGFNSVLILFIVLRIFITSSSNWRFVTMEAFESYPMGFNAKFFRFLVSG